MMKKSLLLNITTLLLISWLLIGCGPTQKCSYCGEIKECNKYDVLGVERYICRDCINNADIVSNNVITEYKCDEIDSFYLPSKANDEASSSSENTSMPDDASDSNSQTLSNQDYTFSNLRSKQDILSDLSSHLEKYALTLSLDEGNDNQIKILNQDGSDALIHLTFSRDTNGNPKLTIEALSGYSSSSFTNVCISSALSFLNSTDEEGTGYNVYNNTISHGNFALNGCRFYYLEDTYDNSENGTVLATFDVSFQ